MKGERRRRREGTNQAKVSKMFLHMGKGKILAKMNTEERRS
jgi:hypothetical protein